MGKNKTPAWVWVGCGCVAIILLGVVAIGGFGLATFSFVKGMVDSNADPESRNQTAMDMMGAETLPDGYRAHVVFEFPFVLKLAVLTDNPAPPEEAGASFEERAEKLENIELRGEQLGDNVLVFLKVRDRGDDELDEILGGNRRSGSYSNVNLGFEVDSETILGEGSIGLAEQKVEWRAHRGALVTRGDTLDGIYATISVGCPDGEPRDLLWFQRSVSAADPGVDDQAVTEQEAVAAGAAEGQMVVGSDEFTGVPDGPTLDGTPADEVALRALLGHFQLCG